MAERHGTPVAHTLEQLALDVRERRRRQAEAEARTLPIRMSFPLVACTLPSFVLVAIVPAVLAAHEVARRHGLLSTDRLPRPSRSLLGVSAHHHHVTVTPGSSQ